MSGPIIDSVAQRHRHSAACQHPAVLEQVYPEAEGAGMAGYQRISVKNSLIIGGVMLAISLAIALVVDPVPQVAAWIIRVLVSLAAGFIGAGILGTVTIENPRLERAIKGGGPVVLTIFFYAWDPGSFLL
jgi:hypothetical protein